MTLGTLEISQDGKWVAVPALAVGGMHITIKGKWIRIARIHDEQWLENEIADLPGCLGVLDELKPTPSRADIFTFTQKIPSITPKYDYPMEWESQAAIHFDHFEDWWKKLPQETRKNVRRSQKRGVVIAMRNLDDKLIKGLIELNNESPMRQGKPNKHYGKTFEQVERDYSSFLDRSDLVGAYVGDELIGLLKIVYRGQIASILQCFSKASHNDKRPNNALMAKAVELCASKGIQYLTYGLFRYGNKRNSPFLEFKIRNGFEEVMVPRYFVPLTSWGKICVASKLYRSPMEVLPHSVIVKGFDLRARWYDFKNSLRRRSSMLERPNSNRQTGRSNPPAGSNL